MKADNSFIDSNIWLYALIETDELEKHHKAKQLLQNCGTNAIISMQIINEVTFNLLRKKILNEDEVTDLIKSFFRLYRVELFEPETLLLSSALRKKYQFSFWDSQIVASAIKADCTCLFTEDMQNFENRLKIINPFK